jgi:hypothetical protein
VAAADPAKPCDFTAMNTVVLGGLGEGEIEIGPGGKFNGTELILSNNTASVIRFNVTDRGAGQINLSGKLKVTDGASLTIDASTLSDNAAIERLQLLKCSETEGAFAPGKVNFICPKASKYRLLVTSAGIRLNKIKGTTIIIK